MNEELRNKLVVLALQINTKEYAIEGMLLSRILQRLSLCNTNQLDIIDDEISYLMSKWDE